MLGPSHDRWGKALSCRPLLWLGTISYSVYLWHEPVLLALAGWHGLARQTPGRFLPDTAIVVIVSILAGWLSYSIIERPTSQLGRSRAEPCAGSHMLRKRPAGLRFALVATTRAVGQRAAPASRLRRR